MFFVKDDFEIRKIVTYHTIYTTIYFPLLLLILYWSEGIYLAGEYKFNSVIFFIIVAELVKYFSSALYYRTQDVNLSKKCDDRNTSAFIKSLFNKHKIREGFKNLIVISIMIFIYSAIAILYGAEVFSKYEETFMFASLLTVMTVLPPCLNLGSQSIVALLLGSKPINKLESLLHQNLYLTVFGAWLGAFVIPLDWDRPWQKWPIPCSFGAMVGYTLSHFIMMLKVRVNNQKKKNKRGIQFS